MMSELANSTVHDQTQRALRYRRRAAELVASSEGQKDAHHRFTLLNLAAVLHRIAQHLERMD
jgi:hypothetical protein